jgi:hypothetical protein
MKRILLFLLAAAAAIAQQRTNIITIIPITDPTTGAPIAAGEARFLDLGTHYVGLKGAASVSASLVWQMPSADGSTGKCWGWASAATLDWVSCGGASLPIDDSLTVFSNHADPTKLLKVNLGAISTGVTRTISFQNASYTLAGTDLSNTFTSDQTFSANILPSGSVDIGSSSGGFAHIWSALDISQKFEVFNSGAVVFAMGVDASTSCYAVINAVTNPLMELCNSGGNFTYSNFSPKTNLAFDLGGAANYWNNGYVHTLKADTINNSILPTFDATYDLGSSLNRYNNLHMNGSITGCTNCGSVSSVGTSSPISGGAITTSGTISCPTCLVTGGGQTISTSDTFSGGLTTAGNILASGSVNLGSSSAGFNQLWSALDISQKFEVFSSGAVVFAMGLDGGTSCYAITNGSASPLMEMCNTGGNFTYSTFSPKTNLAFDLGGPSNYWNNGYVHTLKADTINNTVLPTFDATYDLGSTLNRFNNLHMNGSITGCTSCGTVTSVGTSGPITGGTFTTSGTIGCSTCVTTSGGVTVSGGMTFSAGITLGSNSTLVTGSSGNFYTRPIAGSGISCSGVADGWLAMDTSGNNLLACMGGNRYKVALASY